MSLRRSIRERRSVIQNDYIIFIQKHVDDIGLIGEYPIKF